MKDSFSFSTQWDYSWEVFKDDSTGKFSKNNDLPLTPEDTTHLYFTARCTTNVQGGYDIRYCFAEKSKNELLLTISDGLPAYGSEFYFHISGDRFYFIPKTVYPQYIPRENISYTVTKQQLTLNQSRYVIGDTIMGYIDVEFIEQVSIPKKDSQQRKYFLRGYIRTAIRPVEAND